MRLVYLNGDPGIALGGTKGASIHVREMMAALSRRVERLTAVTFKAGPWTVPVPAFPVHEFGPARSEPGTAPEYRSLAANDDAWRILADLRARGDMDGIYERYSLWSLAGARAARAFGVPHVLEVNAPLVREAMEHRSLSLRVPAEFLEGALLTQASRVIVVSRALRDHVVSAGAAPGKVVVLPNAVSAAHFRPPSPAGDAAADGRFRIVFVGSLKPWHGLDVLVEAFVRFRAMDSGVELLIVGDGPLAATLRERLAAAVPADAFEFTGAVPHHVVPDQLARADVAVAPYPDSPGFYFSPLKLFEYCAAGLPVVASRIGQIDELMRDGEDALLVRPGDVAALVEGLRRLRADPRLRERVASGARAFAQGRTWDAAAEQVLSLFPVTGQVTS